MYVYMYVCMYVCMNVDAVAKTHARLYTPSPTQSDYPRFRRLRCVHVCSSFASSYRSEDVYFNVLTESLE